MPVTKTKRDCYEVRELGEWANITLNCWGNPEAKRYGGEIVISSSFGTWSNAWSSCSVPFKQFLAEANFDYLFTKFMGTKLDRFDGNATFALIKQKILELRKSGAIDKVEARSAWRSVHFEEEGITSGSEDLYAIAMMNIAEELGERHPMRSFFSDAEDWPRATHHDHQAAAFWRDLWPSFIGELKAEAKDRAKPSAPKAPRVLVVVGEGVADPVYDDGVDVHVFDWDNYHEDPKGTSGVPAHFADLAEPIDVPLKVTHQALLDLARDEHRYLVSSREHDGFELSELTVEGDTDEELHINYSLGLNGKKMSFLYSLGFDGDLGGYCPYVEVVFGDESEPIAFSTKRVGCNQRAGGEEDLLAAVDHLRSICGDVRHAAFRWLANQVKGNERPEPISVQGTNDRRFFQVEVAFGNAADPGPHSMPNGTWRGLANDMKEATELAYKECWDQRLDATGCHPIFDAKELPRYLASLGWGHIFVGHREETTRWIYDCAKRTLVSAQVLNGGDWVNLDAAPMADLLQSIHDNDAVGNPDDFDLIAFDSPSWQEACARPEPPAVHATQRG